MMEKACKTIKITSIGLFVLFIGQMAKNMASASDRGGRTCLHLAAANSHLKVCQYLLTSSLTRNGVQDVDKKGRTPLHYAALAGSVDIVALLIEKGADANAQVHNPTFFGWGLGTRNL